MRPDERRAEERKKKIRRKVKNCREEKFRGINNTFVPLYMLLIFNSLLL